MIDQFYDKHIYSCLPTSVHSYNFLVDGKYRLDGHKYMQFATADFEVNKYLNFFLSNIKELTTGIDLDYYYGSTIDASFLIQQLEYRAQDIFFNRLDFVFDSQDQIKLLEVNVNRPTTFSEQMYDQLKNNHTYLKQSLNNYYGQYSDARNVGFLVENRELDAVSSYYVIKQLVENSQVKFHLIQADNLVLEADGVYAFGDIKLDDIIYYIPFEAPEYKELLAKLIGYHQRKLVTIQSSPLTLLVQAKGFHPLSIELLRSGRLPAQYAQIVNRYFINSQMIGEDMKSIIRNKDDYIFKPCYGRTSDGVFTGLAFSNEEVEIYLQQSLDEGDLYIAQELIDIKPEQLLKITFEVPTYEIAYPIFGTFSINREYVQVISRLSKRLITNDGSWTLPIEPLDKLKATSMATSEDVNLSSIEKSEILLETGFNGFGLSTSEYLTNQVMELKSSLIDEMMYVAEFYTKLLKKTQSHICNNIQKYASLYEWNLEHAQDYSDIFTILSRVDIIINDRNQLKVLESNVETPAGVLECFEVEKYILGDKFRTPLRAPNKVVETIKKRLLEIDDVGEQIAIITLDYYEDVYNVRPMKKWIEAALDDESDITVEIITIQNLIVNDGQLYNREGQKIKVLYRYFPLDWFSTFPKYKKILLAIEEMFIKGTLHSLTPNQSIVSQHKSINAIIYKLLASKGFYTSEEKAFIRKYIPFTSVNSNHFFTRNNKQKPYVTKSTLGREGQGIYINSQYEREVIFQELENVQMVDITTVTEQKCEQRMSVFPVYGVYVTDTSSCGIYSRFSDQITNRNAYYLPIVSKLK